MAARPTSSAQHSTSGSTSSIPQIAVKSSDVLPEQWTLPHEWNIEKREMFDHWKMDVQNQIANIAGSLETSLKEYPHPDVSQHMDCQGQRAIAELEKIKRQRAILAGNTLNYGLARVNHPEMF